jgi:predicted small metal-binding protein
VVPGCTASWLCSTEDELLANVAAHAKAAHGLVDIPAELVQQVRDRIVAVP